MPRATWTEAAKKDAIVILTDQIALKRANCMKRIRVRPWSLVQRLSCSWWWWCI